PTQGGSVGYFPTKKFKLSVDSATVVNNGTVPIELANQILPAIEWTIDANLITKNNYILLDMLATNNWERPVYFAITTGKDSYIGLEEYFQLEGLAYRLIPIRSQNSDGQIGRVDTDIMYDNMMNKFRWGNMNNPEVYLSEDNIRLAMNFRNNFSRLANALLDENKTDSAITVLDKCFEVMPENTVPFNFYVFPIAEHYYRAGATEKANELALRLIELSEQELQYYFKFKKYGNLIDREKQFALGILQRINQVAARYNQEDISKKAEEVFNNYYQLYLTK
ncbi:MAG: hypothetical protein PHT69_08855, partial [Bacteroidales bacterium]|nr:hypothetical protein [Bacteroidales bacterium]